MFFIGLDWFGSISTIIGYLMPNPVFKYILNMISKQIFRCGQSSDQTVLFQTIQLSIRH